MLDLRRREFILALGGAAAAWPLRARAQQSMRRLGILMNGAATEAGAQSYLAAFIQAFRQLGWIEGQTVRIEVRWNAGDVALAKIYAAQLIGFQPDVLLVPSTTNLTVIREATSTIPVVFLQVSDPVAQGFVASVIKPGGNLTGFSAYEFSIGSRWLDLLKQAVPDLARTAVMFNPETSPQSKFFMRSIEAAGSSLGVQVTAAPVRATIDIEPAIETFARQPNGGLILTTDSFTRLRQTFIADTASRHRLPAISGAADFAKDGGLMNYGATAYLVDDFRRAASYVDRILRGTKPSDLPVQAPTKYSLVINLKTSKALELTMPLPLLGLADEVIELLGGAAAALPLVPRVAPASEASGQRGDSRSRPSMPVIGFLHQGSPEAYAKFAAAFREGLGEAGYVDGRNVLIEYRWAHGESNRLPELAADLVSRRATVIVTPGSIAATLAAKAATTAIPIVFMAGADPIQTGVVSSLNRPGGNVTGVSSMNNGLGAKQLGLLHELLHGSGRFAVLANPSNPQSESVIAEVQAAASTVGAQLEIVTVTTNRDINPVFAGIVQRRPDGLLISPDPLFTNRLVQLATLAARHAMPAIYSLREFAAVGGLMTYGSNFSDMFRQAGNYTGRVLNGEKPAEMPILQPTKFELVINLQTAAALGLDVPATLLARADEVIE